ncbi:dihydrodipicolinate synthase family protein [Acetobacter persici]|uniref:dihydrodipicolinate synthase family protein n=1 Tax=Acetobacter persici TaxID=1076596 RepID=UPI001BADFCE1|nr:dihydrodipicolinate synthase family protein [Acetobacter persici]MBS1017276.1 dihydrodipicolinate synthase family protein [Acetobacter persici]
MIELRGVYPYLISPLDDSGLVRTEVLGNLIEHLLDCGVHGLAPLGSTGEFAYLDAGQRLEVVRATVQHSAGRVPVIAGVAATTISDAVRQVQAYKQAGADGILAILESYFPVNDTGVEAYFTAIADEAGDMPVVLYTNPQFQRSDLSLPVIARLSRHPAIRAIKDASTNTGRLLSIIQKTQGKLAVFAASSHVPAAVMLLGGVGWMAGPACLVPRQSVMLYTLAMQGRWSEAMALQQQLWPLNQLFARYTPAATVKAGLVLQGFDVGLPLAPQPSVDEPGIELIRNALTRISECRNFSE